VAEDSLFPGGGGVFPKRPNAAVGVPADEVVGVEFDDRGGNLSRNSWILASSCGGDWGFLFLVIGVSSFLFLILGIAKAATFVTAYENWFTLIRK
jgi:hypothetical protein